MNYIVYLRLRYFYVSGLREPNPTVLLRDKFVLDADRRAEERGVRLGMKESDARAILERGSFVVWRGDRYEAASRRWLDVCCAFANAIEPEDQHSAYLDLTGHPQPWELIPKLQERLAEETGLPMEIGVARSKWIAKLAAAHGNPWEAHVSPADFLAPLPVFALSPIAPEHRARLRFLGYRTVEEASRLSAEALQSQFGKEGARIHRAARGALFEPVRAVYPPESLSEFFAFEGPADTRESLDRGIEVLAKRIGARLRTTDRIGYEMALFLEAEGKTLFRERTFAKPIGCERAAGSACRLLLADLDTPILSIRALMKRLERPARCQPRLFGLRQGDARIDRTLRTLRTLFGDHSVRRASEIPQPRRRRVLREWMDATGWR